jgi:hypothetical protein
MFKRLVELHAKETKSRENCVEMACLLRVITLHRDHVRKLFLDQSSIYYMVDELRKANTPSTSTRSTTSRYVIDLNVHFAMHQHDLSPAIEDNVELMSDTMLWKTCVQPSRNCKTHWHEVLDVYKGGRKFKVKNARFITFKNAGSKRQWARYATHSIWLYPCHDFSIRSSSSSSFPLREAVRRRQRGVAVSQEPSSSSSSFLL